MYVNVAMPQLVTPLEISSTKLVGFCVPWVETPKMNTCKSTLPWEEASLSLS